MSEIRVVRNPFNLSAGAGLAFGRLCGVKDRLTAARYIGAMIDEGLPPHEACRRAKREKPGLFLVGALKQDVPVWADDFAVFNKDFGYDREGSH